MTSQASIEFFFRYLNEKHKKLIVGSNDFLLKLVGEDVKEKRNSAVLVRDAVTDLAASLPSADVPGWLSTLDLYLKNFIDGGWTTGFFVAQFLPLKLQLEQHEWVFSENPVEAFDFDSIFEKHRRESRLPQLLDEVVKILEDIHSSGEVDSIAIVRALGKVIATVKKSKDGSYFSINSAWEFLLSFLNNYMWGELSKIPVVGSAFDALRKTIDEANEEMFKVHSAVKKEMEEIVEAEISDVEKRTQFSFISYDKVGKISSAGKNLRLECSA